MTLVFFDFDGTITTNDSLIKFIRYSVGDLETFLGLIALSPVLLLYKLRIIPNYKAKQYMLSYFFKGMNSKSFQKIATEYSLKHINSIVRKKAIEKIAWHKKNGHQIVIVSASLDCWLRPWCELNNLKLIATKLEIKNNILTGKLETKNCYGKEKVNRIKELYNLENYDYIYAYGDSRGDKELLMLADESYYKPFRKP